MTKQLKQALKAGCSIFLGFVVAAAIFSPAQLKAQAFFGSIVGTVTDTSGGVIPGATVTLTNTGTNEKHTVKADAVGNYQFVDLVPATYKIEVSQANFKHFIHENILVDVKATVRINAALQVGAASETVEVTTAGIELQADSPTVSNKVEAQQVAELPLNGRNMMGLVLITPGVMGSSAVEQGATLAQNNNTSSNPLSWGGGSNVYTINGGDNEEYIDGAPINMIQGSNIGIMITADAVQEFNIDTNVGDSSEGRATGGVINMTAKSGTNNFHATAYEYFRNADLNANNFINKINPANIVGRPKYNQNLYGFNLGLPIKKDKIFFFGSYEVDNLISSSPSATNVPCNGNANCAGGMIGGGTDIYDGVFTRQISDPTGNCPSIASPLVGPNGPAVKGIYHDSIAGTYTMGQGCWDGLSTVMRTFWATQANTPSTTSNYLVNMPTGNVAPEMNTRLDWNVNPRHRAFAHVAWWAPLDKKLIPFPNPNVPSALPGGKPWNLGMETGGFNSNLYILGDTWTINQKTVFDIRAEWLRFRFSMIPAVNNFDFTQLNGNWGTLAGYMPANVHFIPAPNFNSGGVVHNLAPAFLGFNNSSTGTWSASGQGQQWDNYGLNGTLNYLAGKHSLKFGFEARQMSMEVLYGGWSGGAPSFGLKYSNAGCSGSNCGDEWADFLMGYFTNLSFGGEFYAAEFNHYQAYFASDTWQYNRKLTLSLGIRYELPGGLAERQDRTIEVLPNTFDANTGAYGTEALVNTPLAPGRSIFPVKKTLFDPRLGFAYRLDDKTVIRGGYGVTHQAVDEDSGGNGAPGFTVNNSSLAWSNPTGGGQTPTALLSNPIPNIPQVYVPRLGRSNPAFLKQLAVATQISGGQGLSGFMNVMPLPYFQQYNLTLQREIGTRFQISAAYVGSHAIHLKTGGNIDQILPWSYTVSGTGASEVATAANGPYAGANLTSNVSTGGTIKLQDGSTKSYANGVYCSPNGAFCNNNYTVGKTLRLYPNYSSVNIGNLSYGNQTYNALQVSSSWRIQGGGMLGLAYTWAKTMNQAVNQQDYFNHAGDRTVAGVPARLVVNFSYPLPIGQGQRFLNGSNPIVSRVVSGWTINDITSYQHGAYLAITSNTQSQMQQNFGGGTTRATYIAGCNKSKGGSDYSKIATPANPTATWFNTACFAGVNQSVGGTVYQGPFDWGNERANDGALYASGIRNWDLSLLKTTKIAEKLSTQLRIETFNTFNRFQPGSPNTAAGNGAFGQITSQANNPRNVQISLRLTY
jgi:hypothetical protein